MKPLIESGSSLSTFRTCPKRYHFEYERKLSPKGYSGALGLGTMVHYWVEMFNLGKHQEDSATAGFGDLIKSIIESHPQAEEDIEFDSIKALSVFKAWLSYWSGVDTEYFSSKNHEFLSVEGEWKYPLDITGSFVHAGRRDGYFKNKVNGKHFLYELKTSADSGQDNYIHRLASDHQISANVNALLSEGKQVDGVLYDIIFKPAIRQKKDETKEQFAARYGQVMMDDGENYFKRVLIDRLPKTLKEYNEETYQQMTLIEAGYRYRNTSACMKFNSLCPYHNLCMDPDVPELENEFNKRTDKFRELKEANENNESIGNKNTKVEYLGLRTTRSREDSLPGNSSAVGEASNSVGRERTPFSS